MYAIVHFRLLYASTRAVTFDNLHPVKHFPRDATADWRIYDASISYSTS